MKRRIRIAALWSVALVAVFAVAAASASAAAPEYQVCAKASKNAEKKYTGKYSNKTCSEENVKNEGKYELESWEHAKKLAFKGSGGEGVLSVYTGITKVAVTKCEKAKSVGEVTGPKTFTTVVTFEKCKTSGKVCTSTGAKAGDIVTYTLDGEIGPISTGTGVGVKITGAGPEHLSAKFECEGLVAETKGSVVGEQTGDLTEAAKSWGNVFTTNAQGEPTIRSFTGGTYEPLLTKLIQEGKSLGEYESGENTSITDKGEGFKV